LNAYSPIRVGIDGRILMHYEMRGFTRYTLELFRAMKEIGREEVELISFSPGPIANDFRNLLDIAPVVFPMRREILWEQVDLPRQLREQQIDVFHVTVNRGLPYKRVCKYVLTCHDVIDRLPEYCQGDRPRTTFRKSYADFAARHSADKYLTVSEFSKREICRFHGLDPRRIAVVPNAAGERFHQHVPPEQIARVQARYKLPREYFLFLGGFDARKNVGALVDAYGQLPTEFPPLVLAGEHKWEFDVVAKRISALGLAGRVFCPDGLNDDDLPALYQGATALVHPSLYEGFGLQLVEAMASGVPVLASDATSLPEVLDGCGLLFDPRDPGSIARQMERVARDASLRREMAEKGRRRARVFSWHTAAQQVLTLYLELLGRHDNLSHCQTPTLQEQAR
jgi:glycosyltransferase involved in cell wall biosynthesis